MWKSNGNAKHEFLLHLPAIPIGTVVPDTARRFGLVWRFFLAGNWYQVKFCVFESSCSPHFLRPRDAYPNPNNPNPRRWWPERLKDLVQTVSNSLWNFRILAGPTVTHSLSMTETTDIRIFMWMWTARLTHPTTNLQDILRPFPPAVHTCSMCRRVLWRASASVCAHHGHHEFW